MPLGFHRMERPLQEMAIAFGDLTATLDSPASNGKLSVSEFARACSHVSVLFGSLGFAFKFAEKDYIAKVEDLAEAAKEYETLDALLDKDIEENTVKKAGSHSRNLLRVKRGIDMVKILFQLIVESECVHLRDSAAKAYDEVFSQYHPWAIRKAVAAGTYALPSKSKFLQILNEDAVSAKKHMADYVAGATRVILYVEDLFLSRKLGIDW